MQSRDPRIEMMRRKVMDAYPGERWRKKVDKMPDKQILAVYNQLLYSGRLIK